MAGYLLDDQSVARLATLLRDYEAGNLANRSRNVQQVTSSGYPTVHVIRVTSTTPSSGLYPGYIMEYESSTDVWVDGLAIKIKDINGSTPAVQRYLGRYAGTGPSGDAVYMIDLSGTTGTTTTCSVLTYDYVSAISCVDGTITPVYTTVCVPCAYFCTTTTTTTSTTTSSTTTSTTTTTTSTAAPTTTSTTTTASPCGQCTYTWNGSAWTYTTFGCTGGCECTGPPVYSGTYVGQTAATNCEYL